MMPPFSCGSGKCSEMKRKGVPGSSPAWEVSILKSTNKSPSPLSLLLGVQEHFQRLTQDDKRYRFVPTAGQGSQTNSSNAVRNHWFESAAIGANERVKPHAETEDSS